MFTIETAIIVFLSIYALKRLTALPAGVEDDDNDDDDDDF